MPSLDLIAYFLGMLQDYCQKEGIQIDPKAYDDLQILEQELQRLNQNVAGGSVAVHVGAAINFTQLGVLGHFFQSCSTIRQANNLGASFFSLNNPYVETFMEEKTEQTYCHYIIKADFAKEYPVLSDEVIKGMMVSAFVNNERLAAYPIRPNQIQFKAKAPKDTYWYEKVFRIKPDFEQDRNCIIIPTHVLDKTVISYNEELYNVLYAHLEQYYKSPQKLISEKVKQLILVDLELMYVVSIESIAKKLLMSSRTLQRKLKEENLTFNQVYEDCRNDLAISFLQNPKIAISEIAYRLNYASNATFSRAFKRWKGKAPLKYRQEFLKV